MHSSEGEDRSYNPAIKRINAAAPSNVLLERDRDRSIKTAALQFGDLRFACNQGKPRQEMQARNTSRIIS